jgi:hypothetical protein
MTFERSLILTGFILGIGFYAASTAVAKSLLGLTRYLKVVETYWITVTPYASVTMLIVLLVYFILVLKTNGTY